MIAEPPAIATKHLKEEKDRCRILKPSGAGPLATRLAILADAAGNRAAETYWPLFKAGVIARLDFGRPFLLTAAEITPS